jgi:hypothetical protein
VITSGELERTGKEAVVTYFNVLSQNSHGGTEENYDKPQLVSWPDLNWTPPE